MVDIRLSDGRLRDALAAMAAIADRSRDCRSFVTSALDELPTLVPSDLTTLSFCDMERGSREVFGRSNETLSASDRLIFDHHFHSHPLVRFHGSNRHGPTQRISDCREACEFRDSALFADYYTRIGIKHVMALPLQIDGRRVISIVFNRSGPDFDDSERSVLEVLRPALACLYRNLLAREEAGICPETLRELATTGNWHLLRISAEGRILEATASALGLLEQFFGPAGQATGSFLPAPLATWRARSRNWGLDRLAGAGAAFTCARGCKKLTARFIPDRDDPDAGYLLLKAERASVSAKDLLSLSLTTREREVLALVVVGRTNAEIAELLGNSARTVQKHMEHIFQKLGVETRTAAAVKAIAAAGSA
jgi:DNA-binding CsgD family transcriptional regulator